MTYGTGEPVRGAAPRKSTSRAPGAAGDVAAIAARMLARPQTIRALAASKQEPPACAGAMTAETQSPAALHGLLLALAITLLGLSLLAASLEYSVPQLSDTQIEL